MTFRMHNYVLKPGCELVAEPWCRDAEESAGQPVNPDLSDRAHEYLFEPILVADGVTLADVFRLLDTSPLLQQVFRRDWADDMCAEARKGPVSSAPKDSAVDERIEYLELHQQWQLDTSNSVYSPTHRLQLHGIGFALQEDAPEHGRKKGERIAWAVSLTPLRELLSLPLRLNPEVRVTEDDMDSRAYGHEISRGQHPGVTLGQILDGVLWELSLHGGPQGQAEFAEELDRRMAEVDEGKVKTIPAEEVFGDLYVPRCAAMFDDLGCQTAYEINSALREIGDDENVAEWLKGKFGDTVIVKPEFRGLAGRAFRKAFRAAE